MTDMLLYNVEIFAVVLSGKHGKAPLLRLADLDLRALLFYWAKCPGLAI